MTIAMLDYLKDELHVTKLKDLGQGGFADVYAGVHALICPTNLHKLRLLRDLICPMNLHKLPLSHDLLCPTSQHKPPLSHDLLYQPSRHKSLYLNDLTRELSRHNLLCPHKAHKVQKPFGSYPSIHSYCRLQCPFLF